MFKGELTGIFTSAQFSLEPQPVTSAEVLAGRGLVGDRYFSADGHNDPGKEITLIEEESLVALSAGYSLTLSPGQSRRNLLTRGVPLNHLVGRDFKVGTVQLRGIRLCEPCGHLEGLTMTGVRKGLIHRGGLRAQIVEGGTIRVGDAIHLECGDSSPL